MDIEAEGSRRQDKMFYAEFSVIKDSDKNLHAAGSNYKLYVPKSNGKTVKERNGGKRLG